MLQKKKKHYNKPSRALFSFWGQVSSKLMDNNTIVSYAELV